MKRWNDYSGEDFTFVVCAYKECVYLKECIDSLIKQTVKVKIIVSTSTPNDHISNICEKYNIEIRINPEGGQIKDYNFAIKQAESRIVMLAHQDDVLVNTFVENVLNELNHTKDPIIAFTDYREIHNDIPDKTASGIIKVKKLLLVPANFRKLMGTVFGKRLIQRIGNPITHPTVVCIREKMPSTLFREEFKASMDWDLWERLSREKGSFVYVNKVLLFHRMNDKNQSSVLIRTTTDRYDNEYEIFCRFWPPIIARIIMHFYRKAHKYY